MAQVRLEYFTYSLHFRNKKKAYLKDKIEDLESNSKIKNIMGLYRGISDFKKGYQPRTNIVKDKKGDLLQTPTVFWIGGGTISLSYRIYMGLINVMQAEIHIAEPPVTQPSAFEADLAI